MTYNTDIAVIGGGASGLVAAITAKRQAPHLDVYIFEALDRVGKKLITTGNGRCNITNRNLSHARYHGNDVDFAMDILGKCGNKDIEDFFISIGVPFVFEGDKGYPASLQASSVVDCLRYECDRLGIKTVCNCKIKSIKKQKAFVLTSDKDSIYSKTVICCAGLYSGGEKLGSDGSIYRLLKELGLKTVKITPSIVQLKTVTDFTRQLKGIKVDAKASLLKNDRVVAEYTDEVLFCDYGLSGPAIMNISREAMRSEDNYTVSLDLFPNTEKNALAESISSRIKLLGYRSLEEFFTGFLNKRLGQVILKYCGYKLSDKADCLGACDAERIATALKSFRFPVTGNNGFINSQVSAGGISTGEFDKKSLMSKRFSGLFASGELLDIDGDCGGFNLAWAWSSGMVAGNSAVRFLGEDK